MKKQEIKMQISNFFLKGQKTREGILSELKILNDNLAQIRSDLVVLSSLHGTISDLAKKNGEFVEVIRHFFAIERTKADEKAKELQQEMEEDKPTKWDERY